MDKMKVNWAIQDGLQRKNTGKLQSLWLETPASCNLACTYCFASAGEKIDKANKVTFKEIEGIILQAKEMGIDSLGIPGVGEPLLPANRSMTMKILRKCAELKIFCSLFTTGEFIDEKLARELYELPVELLIKCNSLNPDLQDLFVSDPSKNKIIKGYGQKRNQAIKLLQKVGFNDEDKCQKLFGRKSRLALVTSIMKTKEGNFSNFAAIEEIFIKCRQENIIFDADSILKRGRGISCTLHPEDQEYKDVLVKLQAIDRKFGNDWEISQSYIGSPACDRYHHHMYVTQLGEIHPCIGSMGVTLGNIKKTTLQQAWNSPEMVIIRNRKFIGKCGNECNNFKTKKCNSCLGRRTEKLTNETLLQEGGINTIGCWNFQPITD